jgi:hypothetical protein
MKARNMKNPFVVRSTNRPWLAATPGGLDRAAGGLKDSS